MIRTLVEIQGGRVSIRETGTEATVTVTVDSETSEVEGLGSRLYTAEEVGDFQASEAELVAAPLRRRITQLTKDYAELVELLGEAEAELERYRKAHVCTVGCRPNAHVAFTGNQRLKELEAELERRTEERDERERARAALESQMEFQRDRADQNREWAERTEARLAKDAESHMRVMSTQVSATAGMKERVRVLSAELDEKNSALANQVHLLHGPNGVHAKLAEALKDRDRLATKIQKINGAVHSPEILKALQYDWDNWDGEQYEAMTNAVREVRQIVGSPEPGTSQA